MSLPYLIMPRPQKLTGEAVFSQCVKEMGAGTGIDTASDCRGLKVVGQWLMISVWWGWCGCSLLVLWYWYLQLCWIWRWGITLSWAFCVSGRAARWWGSLCLVSQLKTYLRFLQVGHWDMYILYSTDLLHVGNFGSVRWMITFYLLFRFLLF